MSNGAVLNCRSCFCLVSIYADVGQQLSPDASLYYPLYPTKG
jgi:hypothetical protein